MRGGRAAWAAWAVWAAWAACVWAGAGAGAGEGCPRPERYAVESLSCVRCENDSRPAADGFSCECNARSRLTYNGTSLTCVPCRPNQQLSSDRMACVSRRCVEKQGRSSCLVCGRNQISVTQNLDGSLLKEVKCVTCKQDYQPNGDKTLCQPCSLISSSRINSCTCDNKVEDLMKGVCVPKTFIKNRDEYKPKEGILWDHNAFLEMVKIEYLCTRDNTTACQALANLCVLVFYDTDQNGPCRLWLKSNPQAGLPNIMYAENEVYSILNQKKVPAAFKFTGDARNLELKFSMAMYNKDGGSVEFEQDVNVWSSLCPCGKNMPNIDFKLGHNYKHKCKVTAREILSQERENIISPFLLYKSPVQNSSVQLIPIAVAIKMADKDFIKNTDKTNIKLFRRFSPLLKSSQPTTNTSARGVAAWYLRTVTLKLKIEYPSADHTNKIYTPVLVLEYDNIKQSDIKSDKVITLTFAIVNEMGGNNFIHGMEISVGVFAGVAILYSLLQTWGLSRRSSCSPGVAAFYFFIFVCGNIGNVLYLVAFGASLHSLVVFKWQNVIYALPPTKKEEMFLEAFIISAFSLKLVEVGWLNWKQCRTDVFLLDWLTPHLNTGNIDYEVEKESDWRKLLVAKQWCSLQTERVVSVPAYVMVTLFILELLPTSDYTPDSYHYASSAAIFLSVYACMYVLVWLRERRYSKLGELARTCAYANVSIVVFEEELYAHYVHGRYVETSEAGGERVSYQGKGLLPNHPHQAFSLCCNANFRLIYKKLSDGFITRDIAMGRMMKLTTPSRAELTGGSLETIEDYGTRAFRDPKKHSQALLTKFLASFIDQALEGTSWIVRERTTMERLFNIELGARATYPGLSVMLRDLHPETYSYSATIWYGQEWSLATFDLFLFSFTEWLSRSHLLAGFLVLCAWKVLDILRHEAGKRNFLRKTNMDGSFIH